MNENERQSTLNDIKEVGRSQIFTLAGVVPYVPGTVLNRIIFKKGTGNITVLSSDSGISTEEIISPFDNFLHVIEGVAEIKINEQVYCLGVGEGIIIPAHSRQLIKALEQFKIISTVIKSGYES